MYLERLLCLPEVGDGLILSGPIARLVLLKLLVHLLADLWRHHFQSEALCGEEGEVMVIGATR